MNAIEICMNKYIHRLYHAPNIATDNIIGHFLHCSLNNSGTRSLTCDMQLVVLLYYN